MQGTNDALIQPARKAQTPFLGLILPGLPVTEGVPMSKELFISSSPHETKVAVLEDDELVEVYHERETGWALAGSIYKGRVTRVLPGMQSAFVDIGLERDAFLYVSDFMELEEHDEDVTDVVPANRAVPDMRPQAPRTEGRAQSAEATSAGEI